MREVRLKTGASSEPVGGLLRRLIGRDAELRELLDAFEDARRGTGAVVLLAGEAGIGKTRLVEEAAGTVAGLVLWSTCWEGDAAPAFWPWRQLLRELLDSDEGEWLRASTAEDLAQLGPLLGEAGPAVQGDESRLLLFDCVARLLRLAATRQPLLLVVDDLHWADEPSIRLLQFLARDLHGSHLVIVATYRDTDVDDQHPLARCLDDLVKCGRHLTLRGLGEDDVSQLVTTLVDDTTAVTRIGPMLRAHTGGNPFFVRELVRLLAAEGRLSDAAARPSIAVPDTVRAVLVRRLARISHAANDVLATASVVGGEFDVSLVEAVAGCESSALLAALDEACRARLLVEVPQAVGSFRFAHALVREVLYQDLGVPVRAALHGKVGTAIEARGATEAHLPELAHHFLHGARGGDADADKAVHHAERAGAQARRMLAYEEAAHWYERALDVLHLQRGADPTREGALLLALGEARLAAGDRRAREAYMRAAALARERGDPEQLAAAALGLGTGLGGFEVALFDRVQIDLLEEALEAIGPGESPLRSWLLARLSVALSFVEAEGRRLALSEEAVATARRVGDDAALAYSLAAHCDAIAGPDHSEARQQAAEEVIGLGQHLHDPALELLGRRLRLVALLEQGRVAEADADIDAFELVADRLRQPLYRWYVPLWRGMRALMRGDLDESARLSAEAAEVGRAAHSDNAAMLTAGQEWVRLRAHGRYEDAGRLLESVFPPFEHMQGTVSALGVSRLQTGRTAEARVLLGRATRAARTRVRDAEWLPDSCVLAQAAVAVGDHESAEVLLEQLRPYGHRFAVEGIGAAVPGAVSWYVALLARFVGRDDEADEHAARAREVHAGVGLALEPPPLVAPLEPTPRQPPAVAAPQTAALRREGDTWALIYGGQTVRVRDSKGLRDLAVLLTRPGVDVHVAELAGAVTAEATAEALDATAIAAYRARLTDLETELADAEADHDAGRRERVQAERDFLVAELAGALGLGGRARRPGDPVERARKAVTARIRDAIARIETLHPALGRHLTNAVRTGTFCSYQPEQPVTWQQRAEGSWHR